MNPVFLLEARKQLEENAFAFLTKRYNSIPFVVRGYGAGVGVTAAGLFSDILKTKRMS